MKKGKEIMLDYSLTESSWEPPKLDMDVLHEQVGIHRKDQFNEYLIILNDVYSSSKIIIVTKHFICFL